MKSLMSKVYLAALISAVLFMFANCGTTPQLPEEVCYYSDVLCEFTELICDAYPEYCWYINITCFNLAVLCDSTSTSFQKELSTNILKESNKKFKQQLEQER